MDLGESSTSFRIHCLEFYFPRHSVSPFSLFLSFALFFFFLSSPHGAHPLASIPRIASPGISEVLSRIQGLASSLMDGSAILFRSAPLRAHLPLAALVVASLRQCHSMRDYAASEFTHSRKVRRRNRARLTLHS